MFGGPFFNRRSDRFRQNEANACSFTAPGRGVYIREFEPKLYLFQFYHEIDIKRVVEGSPWSFNMKVLIISRMKEGDVPRGISLNNLELWVRAGS